MTLHVACPLIENKSKYGDIYPIYHMELPDFRSPTPHPRDGKNDTHIVLALSPLHLYAVKSFTHALPRVVRGVRSFFRAPSSGFTDRSSTLSFIGNDAALDPSFTRTHRPRNETHYSNDRHTRTQALVSDSRRGKERERQARRVPFSTQKMQGRSRDMFAGVLFLFGVSKYIPCLKNNALCFWVPWRGNFSRRPQHPTPVHAGEGRKTVLTCELFLPRLSAMPQEKDRSRNRSVKHS